MFSLDQLKGIMTSQEIKDNTHTNSYSLGCWLREIALQLAIMNEREAVKGLFQVTAVPYPQPPTVYPSYPNTSPSPLFPSTTICKTEADGIYVKQ